LLPLLLRDNVQRTICGINVEILQKYYQDFFTTSKIETLYLRDKYIIYNKLIAGEFKINETTPKEFVFGLLFALPLISGESKITFNKKIT
jgi:hypothetical protein